jgi:UDP-GlcNAc:undecaprenyl-phosphate/decaprenyl-phosphate GlcNAc-1-phosphate transferase
VTISSLQFGLLGLFAVVTTGILTWPLRILAIRIGAMDVPNIERKDQKAPVPYLGGVAIALGISIVTITSSFVSKREGFLTDLLISVLLPAIVLGTLGLVDDLKSLSPWPRLVMQSLVGTFVATIIILNGTVGTPFSTQGVNSVISILWIVTLCNSINFFDNLDGAASGAVAIISLGVFVISIAQGQELVAALSVVTAGSSLGFLIWNKSPAKIYMGDAGALFLGVILSILTIRLDPGIDPLWQSLAIPVVLLSIPLLDTSVSVTSRILRGVSPLTGGRDHLSHRLIRSGLTRRNSALVLWGGTLASALVAISIYSNPGATSSKIAAAYLFCWALAFFSFIRTSST